MVYFVVMSIIAPGFFSLNNIWNLLFNLFPLLIIAIGQTYVMITAGIDLSATSIVAVTSVLGGMIMSSDTGLVSNPSVAIGLGVIVMLCGGAILGTLNGVAVTKLGMPPFMVTLTTMMFFSGFAIWLTKSQNIYNLPQPLITMTYRKWLGIPIPLVICLVVILISYLILNRMLIGRWLVAVGLNPKTAQISGVKVMQTIIFAYLFSGICAAIGSILYTARLETGSPVMAQRILLDIIGAVVIGGTSLFGGKGKIQWTILGVLFIVLLDNSLNIIGLSFFLIMIVKGTIILMAAVLNMIREKSLKAL